MKYQTKSYFRIKHALAKEKVGVALNTTNKLAVILLTTSVQIIVFEILKTCKLVPHSIEGVGYGRYVKAFAKGYLSLEETISAVYHAATDLNGKYVKLLKYDSDRVNGIEEKTVGIGLCVSAESNSILLPCKQENFLLSLLKAIGR